MRAPRKPSSIVGYLVYILLNILARFSICVNKFKEDSTVQLEKLLIYYVTLKGIKISNNVKEILLL